MALDVCHGTLNGNGSNLRKSHFLLLFYFVSCFAECVFVCVSRCLLCVRCLEVRSIFVYCPFFFVFSCCWNNSLRATFFFLFFFSSHSFVWFICLTLFACHFFFCRTFWLLFTIVLGGEAKKKSWAHIKTMCKIKMETAKDWVFECWSNVESHFYFPFFCYCYIHSSVGRPKWVWVRESERKGREIEHTSTYDHYLMCIFVCGANILY